MADQGNYDLLVIGGGIHGAGVAQAAAAAGYSALVLEQGEVASGTSSRSSKLIHGGLRYLEQGQYSLVRECLRERSLLLKLAPDLVQLRPFFIPVYGDSSRNRFVIRAGLTLYSLLGGASSDTRFRSVPKREWGALDGLKTENLRAVFQYWDAQTDDLQLTRSVMASAQSLGVELKSHAKFCSAKRISCLQAADLQTGDSQSAERWEVKYDCLDENAQYSCTVSAVVNAAGPWVNDVLARVQPKITPINVDLVQGAHIVLEGEATHGIYYLESPRDKRPVFVMPWQTVDSPKKGGEKPQMRSAILLGTTETDYTGDPAKVQPLPDEQEYLLETYRHYFFSGKSEGDVKLHDAFAGLRVLPVAVAEGQSHAARHRETILQPDRKYLPGLVSIYGGKLTTYRSTAQRVVQLLVERLPRRTRVADTCQLPLSRVTGE